MRPQRPHIATLKEVRIRRTREGTVIEYLDPAFLPVVISVGPDADNLSDTEVLDVHNAICAKPRPSPRGASTSS